MSILRLNLKKQWFDMIASGEKTEEYREIKEYWVRRLIDFKEPIKTHTFLKEFIYDMKYPFDRHDGPEYLFNYFCVSFRKFDMVMFKNGYRSDAPSILYKLPSIAIGAGKETLGGDPHQFCFVLKLGEQIV